MSAGILSAQELRMLETNRVKKLLADSEEPLTLTNVFEVYEEKYKVGLKFWKDDFTRFEAFLRYECGAIVCGDQITLSSVNSLANESQTSLTQRSVQYIAKPQFSQFYGFGSDKEVPYNVWRLEVESAIKEGFHANEVISEQIRRSLQGEAKTKLIGLASGTTPGTILDVLNQFYSDVGATTGDEMLSAAYRMKQKEDEEVAAYASRLDNQIRKAKTHGTELLPDEQAIDKHLRLIFWEGLKDSVKDKARHKKDSCKTFANLISAARYGEREINSTQGPRRHARANQVTREEDASAGPPSWLAEVCSTFAREVRETLTSHLASNPRDPGSPQSSSPTGSQGRSRELPTCFQCGQVGHLRKGCRNPPKPRNEESDQGNGQMPLVWGNRRQ